MYRTFRTRFRFGFGPETLNLATHANSQGHYAKGTPSPRPVTCVTGPWGSDRLSVHGFRFCFTPLTGVLFTFRSRYCFAIGHQVVLSLAGWSPRIRARFHGPGVTRDRCRRPLTFRLRDCHTLRWAFPGPSSRCRFVDFVARPQSRVQIPQPLACNACGLDTCKVWAGPRSLAATEGVDVSFLSCRYLDVSVPCVPRGALWIHAPLRRVYLQSFPNLGHPRIKARSRLPEAFRR